MWQLEVLGTRISNLERDLAAATEAAARYNDRRKQAERSSEATQCVVGLV
jgi:hypothetical protein